MCLAVAVSADPLATLTAFRDAAYGAFGTRRDALFEVLDALLTAGAVPSPVYSSLAPAHRRGHGSLYAALANGNISASAAAACPKLGARCAGRRQAPGTDRMRRLGHRGGSSLRATTRWATGASSRASSLRTRALWYPTSDRRPRCRWPQRCPRRRSLAGTAGACAGQAAGSRCVSPHSSPSRCRRSRGCIRHAAAPASARARPERGAAPAPTRPAARPGIRCAELHEVAWHPPWIDMICSGTRPAYTAVLARRPPAPFGA